jgi:hypothetical protein
MLGISVLLASIIPTGPLNGQTCTNPPAGLVGWWSGDGHAFDLVGANHGTPQGGVSFAQGELGRAFAFTTTNDWIRLPTNLAILSQTVGTVEFWVKITSLQEETVRLFSVAETGVAYPNANTWAVDYRGVGAIAGAIQIALVANGSIPMSAVTPTGTITDTNWHHLAVVADGVDPIQVYVDGAAQVLSGFFGNTADRFFGHAPNASVMAVGAIVRETVYAEGVKQIDELCIYDRPLSASEVAATYSVGGAGKCKPPFPAPAGLMNWWPAENHTLDIVGASHGTPRGAVGYAAGKVGQAFSFNGANTWLVMPPVLTNAGAFSFECWLNVRHFTHSDYTPVFCQPCESQSPDCIPGEYWFFAGNETSYGSFSFSAVWHDTSQCDVHPVIPFGVGTWEHVAVTYDGEKARVYWNGQLHSEENYAGKTLGNLSPFWVGRAFVPHSNGIHENAYLDGLIDELSVYSRALTAEEIAAIHAGGSAGKAPSLSLRILGPAWSNGNLVFSFATVSNRSYTVQFNDDLATTNWLFYTDLTGNGGIMGFATRPTDSLQRYFRVRSGN